MPEENFSAEQSLQVIRSMIARTKQDISGKSHYFLVWGWITFIACVAQFVLKHVYNYEKHYLVWLLVFVGVAYSIFKGIKDRREEQVTTFIGDSMKALWLGMGITYGVLSVVLSKIGWNTSVFPFFIILYALGTFVSGTILQFKPLIVGGIIAWGLAIVAVFLHYDYQMLMGAAAILVSYIIPAYLLPGKPKFF